MIQIPELDKNGLREFALVTSGVLVGLFCLLLPRLLNLDWPTWPWILAAVLSMLGFVVPMALRPIYRFWMAPIIVILVLLGTLIVLAEGSAIAPFIYTLF